VTGFRKAVTACPSQSAWGARGSAAGKLLWTPLSGDIGKRRAPWHQGWGCQGSASLQSHGGRPGQKQWSEAFGRGLEGKKKSSLSSNCMGHFSGAAPRCQWRRNGERGGTTHIKETTTAKTRSLQPAFSIPIFARRRAKGSRACLGTPEGQELCARDAPGCPPAEPRSGPVLRDMSGGKHWGWTGKRARKGSREDRHQKTTNQMLLSLGLQERTAKTNGGERQRTGVQEGTAIVQWGVPQPPRPAWARGGNPVL